MRSIAAASVALLATIPFAAALPRYPLAQVVFTNRLTNEFVEVEMPLDGIERLIRPHLADKDFDHRAFFATDFKFVTEIPGLGCSLHFSQPELRRYTIDERSYSRKIETASHAPVDIQQADLKCYFYYSKDALQAAGVA